MTMQITAKDRQSLPDIALIALGSLEGVFDLAVRNHLSVTASLPDGLTLDFESDDIISEPVRSAYAVQRICPASDLDPAEYKELLYATAPRRIASSGTIVPDPFFPESIDRVIYEIKKGIIKVNV